MTTLAAVDLGAQSGRVAVGKFDGERLSVTEVHRFANVPVRLRETLYWDILRIYQDVLDGLRAAARAVGRVDTVAVDSWAVDFGVLDRRGRLLQNPVHYRDARRARAVEAVLAEIPARELYERTGIQLLPINTVFSPLPTRSCSYPTSSTTGSADRARRSSPTRRRRSASTPACVRGRPTSSGG
jgi:rhamnulokinase